MKNPSAFPFAYEDRTQAGRINTIVSEGMTLRDYFAAAALPGLIASYLRTVNDDAKLAYEYADAMLAEREKGQQ